MKSALLDDPTPIRVSCSNTSSIDVSATPHTRHQRVGPIQAKPRVMCISNLAAKDIVSALLKVVTSCALLQRTPNRQCPNQATDRLINIPRRVCCHMAKRTARIWLTRCLLIMFGRSRNPFAACYCCPLLPELLLLPKFSPSSPAAVTPAALPSALGSSWARSRSQA